MVVTSGFNVTPPYMTTHTLSCEYRVISYKFCNEILTKREEDDHLSKCRQAIVDCPNNCDVKTITRDGVEEHINVECGKTTIDCLFAAFGCNERVTRSQLSNHVHTVSHWEMLIAQHMKLELKCTTLSTLHTQSRDNCLEESDRLKEQLLEKDIKIEALKR